MVIPSMVKHGELAPVVQLPLRFFTSKLSQNLPLLEAWKQHREDPDGHDRSAGARRHVVHHHVFPQRQLLRGRLPRGKPHASRLRGTQRGREAMAWRRISLEGTVGGVQGTSNLVSLKKWRDLEIF